MARPVEFDRDTVLTNAMEQFWREGYQASSVDKLLECMGINRGTLYNSFGNKNDLFKSCVDHYNDIIQGQLDKTLGNDRMGAWESISAWFNECLVKVSSRRRGLGCLLVNSVCQDINYDRQLRKIVRSSLAAIRAPLLMRVRQARKAGELKKGVSVELAVDLLMNLLHGARVNCREGMNVKQLGAMVDHAILSLKDQRGQAGRRKG